ncbi:hypothetical protein [Euzebya sp.]|uniref:hypothetical protein n=1 Tax=Euzebya sp. TaxID=1971409 RepID=UPI003559E73C
MSLVAVVAGCGTSAPDGGVLARAVAAVPADVAADGLLVQRGAAGDALLVDQLGLAVDDVDVTARTPAPSLRVVLGDVAGVADRLADVGFAPVASPDGWQVLHRTGGVTGFAGVPVVAVGGDRVVVGGDAQVRRVIGGGEGLGVPPEVLAAVDIALLHPALGSPPAPVVEAADLPPVDVAALTAVEEEGTGQVVLVTGEEVTQAEAVAAAVRVRTAGPLGEDGAPLLEAGGSLARGEVITVDVTWRGDPRELLGAALGGGLLDFLDRPG